MAAPLVVAAAVVLDGRLLAARRVGPPALAGRWELPGGKVEPGEEPTDALHRELGEELGLRTRLGARVGGDWMLPEGGVMRVWAAVPLPGSEARPGPAHDLVMWLAAEDLRTIPWLDADVALLPDLTQLLAPGGSGAPQRLEGDGQPGQGRIRGPDGPGRAP